MKLTKWWIDFTGGGQVVVKAPSKDAVEAYVKEEYPEKEFTLEPATQDDMAWYRAYCHSGALPEINKDGKRVTSEEEANTVLAEMDNG